MSYQSVDAATRTIVIYDPELRMHLEGIEYEIDVLGSAISQLLQNFDFVDRRRYAVVLGFRIDVIIGGIDVYDLQSNDSIVHLVVTRSD